MNTLSNIGSITLSLIIFLSICSGCKGESEASDTQKRGEPVLTHESPVYDENTGTFSLVLKADSVEGAKLTYSLIDGDSAIMSNDNGLFSGIAPLEDGYDVKLEVCWNDTVIERRFHILDFVIPKVHVEKISPEDFAVLINSKDKDARQKIETYIAQGVVFNVVDSKMQPQMLSDAITLIETGAWKSVDVVKLQYDENNLITQISVRPIGEQSLDIDEDDVDYEY